MSTQLQSSCFQVKKIVGLGANIGHTICTYETRFYLQVTQSGLAQFQWTYYGVGVGMISDKIEPA